MSQTAGVQLLQFIAESLRELRRKHGLTQEQTAALLKTDMRWYQRVEAGQKDIRATTIDRLGAVFGISGVEFLFQKLPETKIAERIQPAPHRPKTKPALRKRSSP